MNIERDTFSRRDLFHATKSLSPSTPESPAQLGHILNVPLDRRHFIKLSAASVISLTELRNRGAQAREDQPETDASWEKEATLTDTIKESTLLNAGNIFARHALLKLGIPIGNANSVEQNHGPDAFDKLKPYQKALGYAGAFGCFGGFGPLFEEFQFRLIPSFILSKIAGNGTHWEVGVPVSTAFALYHNVAKDEYGDTKFHKKIPLPQFTAGLYFWKAMRERGFLHAVTSHATMNTESLTFGILMKRVQKINGKK